MSIHAWPDGNVFPCCVWDVDYPFGNVNENTLSEIYNSDIAKDTRLKMLRGEKIEACYRCNMSSTETYRTRINRLYNHTFEYVDKIKRDGSIDNLNFHLWDLRISNLCNFKCRSCGHGLSSSWYEESLLLNKFENTGKAIININNKIEFIKMIEPHYEYVEEIYFAGGEPLMMQEHYDILDKLIELNKTDVIIRYSTNFSNLKYKNKHIFDYWKHFKNLELYISVDGVNKIGEYVRKGFKNEIFHNNVNEFLKSEIKPKAFGFAVTFGSLNYLHLFDIVLDFFNNNYINMNEDKLIEKSIFFNPITEPAYYDCSYLPENYKSQFFKRLENFELELLQFNLNEQTINWIIQQLNFVYDFSKSNVFNKEKIEEMIKINNILDVSRNENFYETFDYFSELNNIVCNSI
jgi:organic radical activating enzyme